MKHGCTPVALSADRHYEALRDAVWLRVVADDPRMPWAAFEDAYQEAWAWITARHGEGRPVVAESGSPVAYLAQAVRRRYVDDLRAARRGVGRNGGAPVVEALDDHAERIAAPSCEDDAREARRAISTIYLLARERLTARELQAFALSYLLEMKPAEAAQAMGVSAKRLRNLRWDSWRKVGTEVLGVLEGRLQWCASPEATELRSRALAGDPDARGPFRVHLACCPACSHRVAEARRAAAVLLPLPLLLADTGARAQRLVDALEVVRAQLAAWTSRPALRVAEWTAATPPAGRVAAAATVLATAVGGGQIVPVEADQFTPVHAKARNTPPAAVDSSVRMGRPRPPAPAREASLGRARRRASEGGSAGKPTRAPSVAEAPAASAPPSAPTPAPAPAPAPAQRIPLEPAPSVRATGEFGFE